MNFQDVEIRRALHAIARFNGINLVISDDVSGRLTLQLDNVPWKNALDLILRSKQLDKRWDHNVLFIGPADEIAAQIQSELENRARLMELEPLVTEFIQIHYADSTVLAKLLETSGQQASLKSSRGQILVDQRTNSMVVTGTKRRIETLREILKKLDVPIRQVIIEARIVTASVDFSRQVGVRWNLKGYLGNTDNYLALEPSGNVAGNIAVSPGSAPVVDLGISGESVSRFVLGWFTDNYLLDLELSALARDGRGEVIARPKVIAADKQTAVIASGVEIPYQESSISVATTTSFKKAVLSLSVTPQIIPDNRVIMMLKINQDSLGNIVGGIPLINTNELSTQVLVRNGDTIVLGGIYITQKAKSVTKTPLLGDIPILGRLFKRTISKEDKQELLIFITPRILLESGSA